MEQLRVAGQNVADPLNLVKSYIAKRPGTISRFDLLAGTSPVALTAELIKATRVVASRISKAQEAWLLDRSRDAPWGSVPVGATFTEADPLVADGLYDGMNVLWDHFASASDKPFWFGDAKLSKVLYLMRPRAYPIVDSRLASRYRRAAKALRPAIYGARPELEGIDGLTWEAIRQDLVALRPALGRIRASLLDGDPLEQRFAGTVDELQILDILVWGLPALHRGDSPPTRA